MLLNVNEFVWAEKYRPQLVNDIILPKNIKEILNGYILQGDFPNILLTGTKGIGKTTIAFTLLDQIDADYIKIDGSTNGNIDTLRGEITEFASSVSFKGKRKFVLIDEADNMSASMQTGLRGFIEQFSSNCGFIFTCNFPKRIIEPLHSRFAAIDVRYEQAEKPKAAMQFLTRLVHILDNENVTYDKKVLVHVIQKYFPDWRRTLNELQQYSVIAGTIDTGVLSTLGRAAYKELIQHMKEKSLTKTRDWIGENGDIDGAEFFRYFYDESYNLFKHAYVPELILTLAKYQYQAAFVADPQINFASFCVEVMVEGDWA